MGWTILWRIISVKNAKLLYFYTVNFIKQHILVKVDDDELIPSPCALLSFVVETFSFLLTLILSDM